MVTETQQPETTEIEGLRTEIQEVRTSLEQFMSQVRIPENNVTENQLPDLIVEGLALNLTNCQLTGCENCDTFPDELVFRSKEHQVDPIQGLRQVLRYFRENTPSGPEEEIIA